LGDHRVDRCRIFPSTVREEKFRVRTWSSPKTGERDRAASDLRLGQPDRRKSPWCLLWKNKTFIIKFCLLLTKCCITIWVMFLKYHLCFNAPEYLKFWQNTVRSESVCLLSSKNASHSKYPLIKFSNLNVYFNMLVILKYLKCFLYYNVLTNWPAMATMVSGSTACPASSRKTWLKCSAGNWKEAIRPEVTNVTTMTLQKLKVDTIRL